MSFSFLFQFWVVAIAGRINEYQHAIIAYKDEDPLFTKDFRNILKTSGVTCKKLPPRSPNLNAYAERFVRSIKHECLNKMIFFSEKQLRHVVDQYIEHYNTERPYQGIGNVPIDPAGEATVVGKIECKERLGRVIHFS
ncbi:MAG: transposase [Phycisphaeraceae bacterium]|nr:transposase [Phycisphaeraceae bacterium]